MPNGTRIKEARWYDNGWGCANKCLATAQVVALYEACCLWGRRDALVAKVFDVLKEF